MTWHLQPSGYVLLWVLSFCGYVLFWLWQVEIGRRRGPLSVVVIMLMAAMLWIAANGL